MSDVLPQSLYNDIIAKHAPKIYVDLAHDTLGAKAIERYTEALTTDYLSDLSGNLEPTEPLARVNKGLAQVRACAGLLYDVALYIDRLSIYSSDKKADPVAQHHEQELAFLERASSKAMIAMHEATRKCIEIGKQSRTHHVTLQGSAKAIKAITRHTPEQRDAFFQTAQSELAHIQTYMKQALEKIDNRPLEANPDAENAKRFCRTIVAPHLERNIEHLAASLETLRNITAEHDSATRAAPQVKLRATATTTANFAGAKEDNNVTYLAGRLGANSQRKPPGN